MRIGDKMDNKERRKAILDYLMMADNPVTGAQLSKIFSVSRQIIVSDISVLKATGVMIFATRSGYIIIDKKMGALGHIVKLITSTHDIKDMRRELEIIVDNGGFINDVTVKHPLYGEIHAELNLRNRHDVDVFEQNVKQCKARLLSSLTDGIHYHNVEAPDEVTMERIIVQLKAEGYIPECE